MMGISSACKKLSRGVSKLVKCLKKFDFVSTFDIKKKYYIKIHMQHVQNILILILQSIFWGWFLT